MEPGDPNFPHEEYALLLGLTGAGSAKGFRNDMSSKNASSIILSDLHKEARPSGVVLPKVLRRKLRLQTKFENQISTEKENTDALSKENLLQKSLLAIDEMAATSLVDRVAHQDAKRLHSKSPMAQAQSAYDAAVESDRDDISKHLPEDYEIPRAYRKVNKSRVFSCLELEKKMSKANAVLLDIQKQLYRGEEMYFQDTDTHGNIYKGWEAFIDAKPEHIGIQDVESVAMDDEAALLGMTTTSSVPTRKMHADNRWFSNSSFGMENGGVKKSSKKKGQRKSVTPTTALLHGIRSLTPQNIRRGSPIPPTSSNEVTRSVVEAQQVETSSSSTQELPTAEVASSSANALHTYSVSSLSQPQEQIKSTEDSKTEEHAIINTVIKEEEVKEESSSIVEVNDDKLQPVEENTQEDKQDLEGEKMTSKLEEIQSDASVKETSVPVPITEDNVNVNDSAASTIEKSEDMEVEKEAITDEIDGKDDIETEEDAATQNKGQKRKQEDMDETSQEESKDADTRSSSRLRKRRK